MRRKNLYCMIITAVLLAVGLVLPFLTGQLQSIGKLVSPLHIPVFICGMTCGWLWGGLLGAVLPLLRMALFGMPALPMALPMTFELLAYGMVTGLIYPVLRRRAKVVYFPAMVGALLPAMVVGRCGGGAAKALLLAGGVLHGLPLSWQVFFTSYFLDTALGAALHLVLVPAVVAALEKAHLSPVLSE